MDKENKYPIFTEKFGALLKEKGISQYRIAEETPLNGGNISNICQGKKRPTDEFMAEIVRWERLGVTLQELQSWRNQDEFPDLYREPKTNDQALKLVKKHKNKRGIE